MLAQKNEDIQKAYDVLQIISKDKNARRAYEAREAAIMDDLTRQIEFEEREKQAKVEGKLEGKLETALNMLKDNIPLEQISKYTEIPIEEILKLQKQ